ncbi:hypothetical protein D3C81_908550 [compost metagenome]
MTQDPGQRFPGQLRAPLLQPEMTADLQQHAAINRVGDLPLLHQPFGLAQTIKCMGVITLVGRQLRLPEKPVQDMLVLTVEAVIKARLETFTGQFILALAQGQAPTPQGDSSQQRRRSISLPSEHFMDVGQQLPCSPRCATLLQQLRMIEFEQAFKQQRALRPRQAQGITIEGLGGIEVGVEQRLLGQPGQTQQPCGPRLGRQFVQRLDKMRPCRRQASLQMQQPTLLRLPTRQQLALQGCRRLRGKSGQLPNAGSRLLETPGKQQRRGDQPHPLRRAQGQLFTQLLVQFE